MLSDYISEILTRIDNPIVLVEDDRDDQELFKEAYTELKIPNKLFVFSKPRELLQYLKSDGDPPFFILCDYNLPQSNGYELWAEVKSDPSSKFKSIPFILWSTAASQAQIRIAYESLIQGFFLKPSDYTMLVATLEGIISYWSLSQHPKKLK